MDGGAQLGKPLATREAAHLANFVIADGAFRLIDMELAGFGDPRIDLAIAQSHIELEERDELGQTLAGSFSDGDGPGVRACLCG